MGLRTWTKGGTSHDNIPPSRPHLAACGVLVHAHPLVPSFRIKDGTEEYVCQDSTMPTAAELMAAVVVANANLTALMQQQAEAKDQEEKEVKEARLKVDW